MTDVTDIIIEHNDGIVLITRKYEPYTDKLVLPGGHVDPGETYEQAAIREGKEETGLDLVIRYTLGVYDDPDRDPRGHYVSKAFVTKPVGGTLQAMDDAKTARVYSIDYIIAMFGTGLFGFDHEQILKDYCAQEGYL